MNHAIDTYQYLRTAQQINPIDACTDAAAFHNVDVARLAAALIDAGIDVARLLLIA